MKGTILLIVTVIFVAIHCGDAGFQSRSYYGRNPSIKSSRANFNAQENANVMDNNKSDVNQTKNSGTRRSGLSAWGIIGIVIAAILLVTSGYYAFVFYPFLCKKERNYDMIELTNVV